MFLTISIQFPGTMKDNIVNNEKPTCPYNSMESVPLQGLRRREKGTWCWLWKGMMVLWYQNVFWLCFAFYNKSLLLIKTHLRPRVRSGYDTAEKTWKKLDYRTTVLISGRQRKVDIFYFDTGWYMVVLGQYRTVGVDIWGSVWSKTAWYMIIMGQ